MILIQATYYIYFIIYLKGVKSVAKVSLLAKGVKSVAKISLLAPSVRYGS